MKKALIGILVLISLSGCIMAPVIGTIQEAGLTESGRQGTLNQALKDFNSALFWQNYSQAQTFAAEEFSKDVREQLSHKKNQGRVVESKIEGVQYLEDSYKAEVDVAVRIQNFSTMIVSDQTEKQVWNFSVYDGWKLQSISANEG